MKFSDGMKFDTSCEYRLTYRSDGWYVVGRGRLMAVNSAADGQKVIVEMIEIDKLKKTHG